MKILFLIPARGGSKGLPGKNIKPLNNKPLICYTIDAALEARKEDDIVCVSTDDTGIISVVEDYGLKVPFIRPAELATDFSTSEQVILHAIDFYENQGNYFDFLVLLQPTSPLRSGKQIKESLRSIKHDTEMIVSVKETDANPYYVLFEEDKNGKLLKSKDSNFTRRQDCPKVYEINGAIYIINIKLLKANGLTNLKKEKFLMDKKSSIDIDDAIDFHIAELLIKQTEIQG